MLRLALPALLLLLAGCASRGPVLTTAAPTPGQAPSVELTQTPFFPQREYQCGPAALATSLVASGQDVTPDQLTPQVYLPEQQGSLQPELIAATRRHGRVPYVIDPQLSALLTELDAGHVVLVLQNLGVRWLPVWHYAVVIGYDRHSDTLLLRSGTTRRKQMTGAEFKRTWQLGGNWGLVVLPPDRLPASARRERYLAAVAALEAIGRLDVADRAYRTTLARWPDTGLAWFGLGNVAYRQGRLDEARTAYLQARALRPTDGAVLNNLASLQAELGCPALGLQTLHSLPPDARLSQALRDALQATEQEILAMPAGRAGCAADGVP